MPLAKALTSDQIKKLALLQNRPTRYEIVVEQGDRQFLLAYTPRKSITGILSALTEPQRIGAVKDILGLGKDDTLAWNPIKGDKLAITVNGLRVGFTGRTQRDAITSDSERPYIVKVAADMKVAA